MIGAPAWLFGNVPQVSLQAPRALGTQLGITQARWAEPPSALSGLGITRARWAQPPDLSVSDQQLAGVLDFFESPLWKYRKVFILGGVGLLGVGLLGLIGAVLK